MPSLSTKDRNAKFNTNGLSFRKKFNSKSSGTLLSAESLTNKSNIPKIPFSLGPSKKCIMIKQFKDKIKSLTNILNETKNLKLLRQQEINEIKNETKRKLDMLDYDINDIYILETIRYLRNVRCQFNNFNTKM